MIKHTLTMSIFDIGSVDVSEFDHIYFKCFHDPHDEYPIKSYVESSNVELKSSEYKYSSKRNELYPENTKSSTPIIFEYDPYFHDY